MNVFERGHNNPPEGCPSVVECSIPQVMGLIGIMLVGCSRPEQNTNPSNQGRSSDFVLRLFIVPE